MRVKTATLLALFSIILYTPVWVFADERRCPQNFNPDEPAWTMTSIKTNGLTIEREFFYQPDHQLRVIKKEPSGCYGRAFSVILNNREERIVLGMYDSRSSAYFLKTEEGEWKQGVLVEHKLIYQRALPSTSIPLTLYELSLTLYGDDGSEIAKRVIPVPQRSPMKIIIEQ